MTEEKIILEESGFKTHRELMNNVKLSDDFLRELGHLLPGEEVKFSISNVKIRVLGSTSFLKENENEILLYITNYQIVFLERKNCKVDFRTAKLKSKKEEKKEREREKDFSNLSKSRSFSGDLPKNKKEQKAHIEKNIDTKRKTSKLTEEVIIIDNNKNKKEEKVEEESKNHVNDHSSNKTSEKRSKNEKNNENNNGQDVKEKKKEKKKEGKENNDLGDDKKQNDEKKEDVSDGDIKKEKSSKEAKDKKQKIENNEEKDDQNNNSDDNDEEKSAQKKEKKKEKKEVEIEKSDSEVDINHSDITIEETKEEKSFSHDGKEKSHSRDDKEKSSSSSPDDDSHDDKEKQKKKKQKSEDKQKDNNGDDDENNNNHQKNNKSDEEKKSEKRESKEKRKSNNEIIIETKESAIEKIEISERDKRVIFTYPLGKILRIKERKQQNTLEIQTKDGISLLVYFTDKNIVQQTQLLISKYAFPSATYQMFCFVHKAVLGPEPAPLFDILSDYKRVIANSKSSKSVHISRINEDFSICSTYPQILLFPKSITEAEIKDIAKYRSRGRLPTIIWIHPKKKSLLLRSSQPCVGIKLSRSSTDEKYLFSLKNEKQTKLYIVDSRPRENAVANMLRGGGFENVKNYKECELEFHNIENIHVIRHSLNDLFLLCNNITSSLDLSLLSSTNNNNKNDNNKNNNNNNNNNNNEEETIVHQIASEIKQELILSLDIQKDIEQIEMNLEQTKWLFHIRLILESTIRVVNLVHNHAQSVLVHCSDGWDRTAQTVATTELLLDPYYRTFEGFLVLIEKEWMQYGHQFALRYGHGDGNFKESQRSPIFPQWLDVVYQLLALFPNHFEFNDDLLIVILDELYSCRFGSFLFNSLKERRENNIFETTAQLWTFLIDYKSLFTNRNYKMRKRPIVPDITNVRLQLWSKAYLKMKTHLVREFVVFERRVHDKKEENDVSNGDSDFKKKKRSNHANEISSHKGSSRKEETEEEEKKTIEKFISSIPPGARLSRSLVHGSDEEKKRLSLNPNNNKPSKVSKKEEITSEPSMRQRSHTSSTRKK